MEEDEVLNLLAQDPGNSIFAEYAEALRKQGSRETAILICLKGLSSNPSCHKGRLVLARALFDSGFRPFAAEQIAILQAKLPENAALRRLAEKFSIEATGQSVSAESKVVSEAEFDFNEIDLIEDN